MLLEGVLFCKFGFEVDCILFWFWSLGVVFWLVNILVFEFEVGVGGVNILFDLLEFGGCLFGFGEVGMVLLFICEYVMKVFRVFWKNIVVIGGVVRISVVRISFMLFCCSVMLFMFLVRFDFSSVFSVDVF